MANKLDEYIKSLREYDTEIIDPEEMQQLVLEAQAGNEYAKEQVLLHNQKLVISLAKKYEKQGADIEDLVMEGNLGILKGIERYNPEVSENFVYCAAYNIKSYIIRFLQNNANTIRQPVWVQERNQKIKEYLKENREASVEEIAKKFKMDTFDVADFLNSNKECISLNMAYKNDREEETEMLSLIGDTKTNVEDEVIEKYVTEELYIKLNELPKEQLDIVLSRFGFKEEGITSLKDLGEKYGVSGESIRLRERKAIELLKKELCEHQKVFA